MADGRHVKNRYIAISQQKSSDFDEILYTAADFELDVRHVIKNEKVALDRLRVRQNIFLVDDELDYFLRLLVEHPEEVWLYSSCSQTMPKVLFWELLVCPAGREVQPRKFTRIFFFKFTISCFKFTEIHTLYAIVSGFSDIDRLLKYVGNVCVRITNRRNWFILLATMPDNAIN